jgi:hypothetical protein
MENKDEGEKEESHGPVFLLRSSFWTILCIYIYYIYIHSFIKYYMHTSKLSTHIIMSNESYKTHPSLALCTTASIDLTDSHHM